MKKTSTLLLFLFLISCNSKKGLELEIINKQIYSYEKKEIKFDNNDSIYLKKSKNIILYKLTNYDNKSYYFNRYLNSKMPLGKDYLWLDNAYMIFLDEKDNRITIKDHIRERSECDLLDDDRKKAILKGLDYPEYELSRFYYDQANFVIHPYETLYFEWYVNLPYGNPLQYLSINIEKNKEYFAKIFIYSDTTNYKKNLSRTDLKIINENGYDIYHGIIESKNKVPIKIVD
ncbi:MAG: hypothetical protein DI588_18435 [Flavobacterium johnsoniae]|nr:MAG: hypothetical protein DI588_18435 [Flavobacterium johnsoniae]